MKPCGSNNQVAEMKRGHRHNNTCTYVEAAVVRPVFKSKQTDDRATKDDEWVTPEGLHVVISVSVCM